MAARAGALGVELSADSARFEGDMRRAQGAVRRFTTASSADLARNQRQWHNAARDVGRFRTGLLSLRSAITLIAGGAGIGAMVRSAGEFEESLAKIVGLVGINREQVSAWREDILALAGDVGRSPQELADALFFITSAGLRGTTAMDTLRDSAKAAASGLGETKDVALAAGAAINAYGEANLSTAQAVSLLVAGVREGNLEAASLASALPKVTGIAAELGIEFHEVNAAIAAMTRTGASADEAATQLAAIFQTLTTTGGKADAALKEVGLDFDKLREIVREKGLLQGLIEMRDALGGNIARMREAVPNVRALRGVLALVGEQAETNIGIFSRLAGIQSDEVNKVFRETETDFRKLQRATQELNAKLIVLGSQILPAIAESMGFLVRAIDYVGEEFEKFFDEIGLGAETLQDLQGRLQEIGAEIVRLSAVAQAAPLGSQQAEDAKEAIVALQKEYRTLSALIERINSRARREVTLAQLLLNAGEVRGDPRKKPTATPGAGDAPARTILRPLPDQLFQSAQELRELTETIRLDRLAHDAEALAAGWQKWQDATDAQNAALEAQAAIVREEVLTPLERFEKRIETLDTLHQAGKISAEEWGRANAQARLALDEANAATDDSIDLVKELGLTFSSAFEDAVIGIQDVANAAEAARQVVKALIDDLLRLLLRKYVTEQIFGAVLGALAGGAGGGVPTAATTAGFSSLLSGGARAQHGADFVVPPGFPNDSFGLAVSSGEHVMVDPHGRRPGGDTYIINADGADAAGLARVERLILQLHGSIERRAVAATSDAIRRGKL